LKRENGAAAQTAGGPAFNKVAVADNEEAKYWMSVLQNLKNRGMKDAFIICTDGFKDFREAIEAVFPSTLVQTCIVYLIPASVLSQIRLCNRQKADIEALARSGRTPQKVALRRRIVLLAHQGVPNHPIAQQLNLSRPTVLVCRACFAWDGMGQSTECGSGSTAARC
jgi:DNA-binding NarL/FixJ family response regulator